MKTLKNTYKKNIEGGWSYPVDSRFYSREFSDTYIRYRQRLDGLYRKADMAGVMEASEDTPALLKHIYVPLRIDEKDIDPASGEVDKVEGLSIVDALRRIKFLAISGAPGSGKSTMTRFLAAALSQTILNETASVLGRRVVVPFILRELDFSQIHSFDDLWNLWIKDMSERLKMDITREFLDFYIEKGWAVVIFDGIDEIGEEQNLNMIRWINDWIQAKSEFKDAMTPLNIIITGRPSGYLAKGEYDRYFRKMYLLPFNQDQIEQYAYNWYGVRYGEDEVKVKMKAKDFIAALKDYGLEELKRRPIYLAMLAYVAETYGELPRTRTLAYSKMVDAYLHLLDLARKLKEKKGAIARGWSYDDKIRIMEELAYKIHTKAGSELDNTKSFIKQQMHIQISRDTLTSYFRDILAEGRFDTVKTDDFDAIIDYFIARTGLIIEPKEGYYQFSHLTFQEYLTAARIYRKQSRFDIIDYLNREIFDRLTKKVGWLEAALLFFGIDTIRAGEEQSVILKRVIKKDEEAHHKFLIDLFTGMEHKISQDDVIKWLKTLVYVWVTRGKVRALYEYLADAISEKSDNLTEIRKCIIDYIKKLAGKILHNEDTLYDSSDIIYEDDCGDERLLCCNIEDISLEPINLLENILLVGFYWKEFREGFFDNDNSSLLPTDKRDSKIAFLIDRYILHNKKYDEILSHKIYSNFTLNDLYLGIGYIIYHVSNNNNGGVIKLFYKLLFCSCFCLFYLNSTNDIKQRTLIKFIFSIFNDRDRAMIMVRDRAVDMTLEVAIDRALAVDTDTDMEMDMAMARDMAMAMDMAIAVGMGMDMAVAICMAMDSAIAMTMDNAMDMARAVDTIKSGRNINDNELLSLHLNTVLFNLYAASKRMADYMGINIHLSKQEFIELYKRIETDEGAVEYFESECGTVDDSRKEEIKEWLNTSYSPRVLMKFVIDNTEYEEFDPQLAIGNYHTSIKEFIEWAEKTKDKE